MRRVIDAVGQGGMVSNKPSTLLQWEVMTQAASNHCWVDLVMVMQAKPTSAPLIAGARAGTRR